MQVAGWYGVAVGWLLLGQWAFFLGGGAPELLSGPLGIAAIWQLSW